jgi:predicted O-methyltransferase YrrM
MDIIQMRIPLFEKGLNDLIDYIDNINPVKDLTMIEIGAYTGESTEIFAKRFGKVITIDPHLPNYDDNDSASKSDYTKVIELFLEIKSKYGNIEYINMKSENAINLLQNLKVDLVYIDGALTYEQVKKDIENYIPLIKIGGFISGHDFTSGWKTVVDAITESLGEIDDVFCDTSWIKRINDVTIVYTYFGQEERISEIVNQKLNTVIIDDCSSKPLGPIDGIRVFRILDDIRWNQPGARNLGFHVSDGWIICADIDHLVTYEMVKELKRYKWVRGNIYFLGREDDDMLHNFFLVHKDDFDYMGGWDEDFSGNWGHDDTYFENKFKFFLKPIYLTHIKTKIFENGRSNGIRDSKHNFELLMNKLRGNFEHTPRLRFNWVEIK